MKNDLSYSEKIFERIKHFDECGVEYWDARELQIILEYVQWRRFNEVINKAIISCDECNVKIPDHFAKYGKMVCIGSGAKRKQDSYKLSRYACYLIVQNANPKKSVVALGQSYFAIQTRRMELTDEDYSKLNENEKRIYRRRQTKEGNKSLYRVAISKGVKNLDRFTNYGYKGLYNGETADDIAKRKGLRYREEILDNMGSEELGANVFRITQTEALLTKQIIKNESAANDTHYKVGVVIRKAIDELGGTMPENLPTPSNSIKDIERKIK